MSHATTLEGVQQTLPMGPVASQEAIKQLGTNGGGFFNANSAHPFENPTPWTQLPGRCVAIFLIPAGLVYMLGRMVKNRRHALGGLGHDVHPLRGRHGDGVLGRGTRQPDSCRARASTS